MCVFFTSWKKAPVGTITSHKNSSTIRTNIKAVPFKGSYNTTFERLQGPPIISQIIHGLGDATHIGESSFTATVTVNVSTPPPFAVNGTTTFTAANGDEFYTVVTGTNTPTGPGSTRAVLVHTIVGGTGRFVNASGTFTGIAINTPTSSTVTFDGNISY